MNSALPKKTLIALLLLVTLGCGDLEKREIVGSPYNAQDQCWEETQPTGVYTRENACGNSVHIAEDEQGQIWYLYSDCDVLSFNELESDDPRREMLIGISQCS